MVHPLLLTEALGGNCSLFWSSCYYNIYCVSDKALLFCLDLSALYYQCLPVGKLGGEEAGVM